MFTVLHIRGEATVIYGSGEVLYRTRIEHRIPNVLAALTRAWDRGVVEGTLGWPKVIPARSPIFDLQQRDVSPMLEVVERHRWAPFGDRVLCQTESRVDAHLVIAALRRSLTLGALAFFENHYA